MTNVNIVVESKLRRTPRVIQLEGMFDVPAQTALRHVWKGKVPFDERDWNVGLIAGPSGSGKSVLANRLFNIASAATWKAGSVIDDFDGNLPIAAITEACSAVGFNTIPSWMKPYAVLSTGEKFRASIARALLECADPIVIDEFTSVVDRQVAKIASHAVQKFVRSRKRKLVAVTCHYDVIDWLQPDWVLEPATMTFQWRSVQRRPELAVEIARVHHAAWQLFAPFHYLSRELNHAATCFLLSVNDIPACFVGVLHHPHASVQNIKRISRIVTLPDYQGLGLAMLLAVTVGSAYKAMGYRFRNYPAHPSFVRAHDRSPQWSLCKLPGKFSPLQGKTSSLSRWVGRPCAVFEYVGEPMSDRAQAQSLIFEQKKWRAVGPAKSSAATAQAAR